MIGLNPPLHLLADVELCNWQQQAQQVSDVIVREFILVERLESRELKTKQKSSTSLDLQISLSFRNFVQINCD